MKFLRSSLCSCLLKDPGPLWIQANSLTWCLRERILLRLNPPERGVFGQELYSFYSPSSSFTALIFSPFRRLSFSLSLWQCDKWTMIHMQWVQNGAHFLWLKLPPPLLPPRITSCNITARTYTHINTQVHTHSCTHTLHWDSYEFDFSSASLQHESRQRGRESCDVYTSQINGRAVCFNNHTECRDTCNCFDVALMATNNGTLCDYGVS